MFVIEEHFDLACNRLTLCVLHIMNIMFWFIG